MTSRSHDSAYLSALCSGARNRDLDVENGVSDQVAAIAGGGWVSDRLRRASCVRRRRAWVRTHGAVPATVAMWTSRESWLSDVRAWVGSPDFSVVCTSARVSIASATVVAVAGVWAGAADHGTGRNSAVTRARIAATLGCSIKTVSRAWTVLGAAGWAVEASRGHGCSSGHTAGNRPSIWHLVSRRPVGAVVEGSAGNVPLPPKAGCCLVSPVEIHSPSGRVRARKANSPSPTKTPGRRRASAPRPLALQRLAAGLVTPGRPDERGRVHSGRRAALVIGLDRGHVGAICDAITSAGLDAEAWTPKLLASALETDMNARGWSWPDRIERPGAFLASRLRRLPARPDPTAPVHGGGTAAGPERAGVGAGGHAAVHTVPPPRERRQGAAGLAYVRQILAEHRRRRLLPDTEVRATGGPMRHGVPVVVVAPAGTCFTCGCVGAPRRQFLPARRAHVCDGCWAQSG